MSSNERPKMKEGQVKKVVNTWVNINEHLLCKIRIMYYEVKHAIKMCINNVIC